MTVPTLLDKRMSLARMLSAPDRTWCMGCREGRPGSSLVTLALISEDVLLRDLLASTPEAKNPQYMHY